MAKGKKGKQKAELTPAPPPIQEEPETDELQVLGGMQHDDPKDSGWGEVGGGGEIAHADADMGGVDTGPEDFGNGDMGEDTGIEYSSEVPWHAGSTTSNEWGAQVDSSASDAGGGDVGGKSARMAKREFRDKPPSASGWDPRTQPNQGWESDGAGWPDGAGGPIGGLGGGGFGGGGATHGVTFAHTGTTTYTATAPPASSLSKSQTPAWMSWGHDSKTLPKVANAAFFSRVPGSTAAGTRTALSPQQHTQILNALLNQPNQNTGFASYPPPPPPPPQQKGLYTSQQGKGKKSKKDRHSQHQPYGSWGESRGGDRGVGGGDWGNENGRSNNGNGWAGGGGGGGGGGGSDGWEGGRGGGGGGWGNGNADGWDNGNGGGGGGGGGSDGWEGGRGGGGGGWGNGNADGWDNGNGGGDGGGHPPVNEGYDSYDRKVRFNQGKPSGPVAPPLGGTLGATYTMPSKTLVHAYQSMKDAPPLNLGAMQTHMEDYANLQFTDSDGAQLVPVQRALYSQERVAKARILWAFPPDKDERVTSVLSWIQTVSYGLGSYGLHKFLQSRERGALITNADYHSPQTPTVPCFDWMTYDQLQPTMDQILQESVATYDPARHTILFVFLPSKSGNSMAVWRRKIAVPNNVRLALVAEIKQAMAALRKDYPVHVEEYVIEELRAKESAPVEPPPPPPKKKKRSFWSRLKFWKVRVEW